MANTKVWTMNETQKDFMDTLKEFGRAVTLMEIEAKTGKTFKTVSQAISIDLIN